MLVLSRYSKQRIMLDGGRIVIEVVEIRGDKVRIGIEAPDGCRVDREEIHVIRQREAAEGRRDGD